MRSNPCPAGLYVHIPFCRKKCAYCDFYSLTDYRLTDAYLTALEREAHLAAKRYPGLVFDSLYVGGGTPSSLSAEELGRLFGFLQEIFSFQSGAEVTLEANPATLDREKLALLKKAGVNRLSLGLQSASDRELSTLSRLHNYKEFRETYLLASEYFDNISLDLMFGLPDQTRESFSETLSTVLSLTPPPAHLSLYALKIEEGTPFARQREELFLPDEDTVADIYLDACRVLETSGYRQYEISNFAKQGCRSRHNLHYWKREEYLGLGPAAHSFLAGCRYANRRDLCGYMAALEKGEWPERSEEIHLTPEDVREEEILLPLRLTEGLDLLHLEEKTGYAIEKAHREKLLFYKKNGFMRREGRRIAFTPKGFLVSNTILAELLL